MRAGWVILGLIWELLWVFVALAILIGLAFATKDGSFMP